jgi:hypothetical protein
MVDPQEAEKDAAIRGLRAQLAAYFRDLQGRVLEAQE